MGQDKLNVAIVGLGFGKEFIPIYQHHPNTNMYAICQRTREKLDEVGEQYGVTKRYSSFEDLTPRSERGCRPYQFAHPPARAAEHRRAEGR